jgi:hypothetical protein
MTIATSESSGQHATTRFVAVYETNAARRTPQRCCSLAKEVRHFTAQQCVAADKARTTMLGESANRAHLHRDRIRSGQSQFLPRSKGSMNSYLVLLAIASTVYFLCRLWLTKSAAVIISSLTAPMIFQAAAFVVEGKLDSLWLIGLLVTTAVCALWGFLLALMERIFQDKK